MIVKAHRRLDDRHDVDRVGERFGLPSKDLAKAALDAVSIDGALADLSTDGKTQA